MATECRLTCTLPVHLIYHVPKCAGQTLHRHLTAVLPPGAYYRTRRRRGWRRLFSPLYDTAQMPDPQHTRVAGGHSLGVSLDHHFDGRELKRSILLRDPVSHLISYYNFRMMRYISRGLHPYSFRLSYLATQRNFVAHFILRNFLELSWPQLVSLSDEEKYDILNAFLASFWYVGDYRRCDELIAALAAELSLPVCSPSQNTCAQWKRRIDWQTLDVSDLAPSTIRQIRQENLLDQRLWETWKDAEHQPARMCPRALYSPRVRGPIHAEAVRFVSQIARRIQRRFGPLRDYRSARDRLAHARWDSTPSLNLKQGPSA